MSVRVNKITKQDALNEIRIRGMLRGACKDYIYRVCYLGQEYSGTIFDESDRIMSYICRAYNITEYGSTSNRIKNVLNIKKYKENPYFQEAFNQIFYEYPNGIPSENPKFKELLDSNIQELARTKQNTYIQDTFVDYDTMSSSAGKKKSENTNDNVLDTFIGWCFIIGVVLIFIFRKQIKAFLVDLLIKILIIVFTIGIFIAIYFFIRWIWNKYPFDCTK